MNLSDSQFKNYVFSAADDRERLIVQHKCFRPSFEEAIERILDEYGLGKRLQEALSVGAKLRILDVGCSEGLFLHDVVALLEERGLREAAEFYGFDQDKQSVATADEFRKVSKPPRPYLNFYVHDATKPLEECIGLRMDVSGPLQFDFIYATMVVEHLPNAQQHIQRFYGALKAGGVIYLRDLVTTVGQEGKAPHPVLDSFADIGTTYIAAINKGRDVASETADWLRQAGAVAVQAFPVKIPVGGNSQIGLDMLRNSVMIVRNMSPLLIAKNLMSQAQYDEIMTTLFRELGPQLEGTMNLIDTVASRPLEA